MDGGGAIGRVAGPASRGMAVVALVASLEAAGIPVVYLRNHEGLPGDAGNDVDLLVPSGARKRAATHLQAEAPAIGWRLLARTEFSPLALVFGNQDTGELLHIDLFDRIEWHALEFADAAKVLEGRRWSGLVHIPDAADEVFLNLVTRLFYEGTVREKHREQARRAESPEAIFAAFGRHLGKSGEAVGRCLQARNWEGSRGIRKVLIQAALARFGLGAPARFACGLGRYVRRSILKVLRPPGRLIVFEGADGVGKSTVIAGFIPWCSGLCGGRAAYRFHWKPTRVWQGAEGPSAGVDPRSKAPRPALLSFGFLLRHLAGYWMGWCGRVWPRLAGSHPVVGDRYSYDLHLDPQRFRLKLPSPVTRWAAFAIPAPDVVVFLRADPQAIVARKPELPVDEIARYQDCWRELSQDRRGFVTVDAGGSPEEVAVAVRRAVIEQLALG